MYSRLLKIDIENFMAIEKAILEFDDNSVINPILDGKNNIISLCGYNDSGKSAVGKALEVLMYDAYENEQVKFIQDDKSHFRVTCIFDDGVTITKIKQSNGKSIWEMTKDGKVVFTNKLADSIAHMPAMPEVIVNYLGVIQDEHTSEKLNVRRNSDKLFLINTSGGDNYKVLNSVLRGELLAELTKRLNTDRNKIKGRLDSVQSMDKVLKEQYDAMVTMREEDVKSVEKDIEKLKDLKVKYMGLKSIVDHRETMQKIVVHPEVSLIDSVRLVDITKVKGYKNDFEKPLPVALDLLDLSKVSNLKDILDLKDKKNLQVPPIVNMVDTGKSRDLKNLVTLKEDLDKSGKVYDELSTLDTSLLKDIHRLHELAEDYKKYNIEIADLVAKSEKIALEMDALAKEYNYKICNNCGAAVI